MSGLFSELGPRRLMAATLPLGEALVVVVGLVRQGLASRRQGGAHEAMQRIGDWDRTPHSAATPWCPTGWGGTVHSPSSTPFYVAADYARATATQPEARVGILRFESVRWDPYETISPRMLDAVEGYRLQERFASRRGGAELYAPDP